MRHQGESSTVSLFSALVIKGAIEETAAPAFLAATGVAIVPTFDPTSVLMRRIAAGERGDVIVAISANFDELVRDGIVSSQGRALLVRTGVGLAVRAGASRPDIATVENFKRALIDARSVAYSRTGASGIYFAELLKRLGIAEAVNARATILEKGLTGDALLSGHADIAVQQLSELRSVQGVDVIGPFPPEVQQITEFSAGLFARAIDNRRAKQLLALLISKTAKKAYLDYGLDVPDREDRSTALGGVNVV
jgi:molybdate transport system substrate-binding protein